MTMPYTDEQRAEAVDLYVEHGAAEAARRTGISSRSIRGWAKTADVAAARDKNLIDAADRLALQQKADRAELRSVLIRKALIGAQAADPSDPKGFQLLSVGVGTFLDKYRLEMGEASEVVITGDMMDQAILTMRAELGEEDTPRR
jgi:transposase-like protein